MNEKLMGVVCGFSLGVVALAACYKQVGAMPSEAEERAVVEEKESSKKEMARAGFLEEENRDDSSAGGRLEGSDSPVNPGT